MATLSKIKKQKIVALIYQMKELLRHTKYFLYWQPVFMQSINTSQLVKFKKQYFWVPFIDFFYGLFYGYPLCCILYFICRSFWSTTKIETENKNRSVYRIYSLLNYVPCEKHWQHYIKLDNYKKA